MFNAFVGIQRENVEYLRLIVTRRHQMTLRGILRPLLGSIFVVFMLAFSHVLLGQAVNGTLLGTVTDASGAAVPNAKVTATDVATGAIHPSATNESGNYTFPDLQPGIYSVTRRLPSRTSTC
jgi:hypothetical protein